MDYIGEIFHGLLCPRHKRNHRHLYHRRQIGQKMADHKGQGVAFAVVIPTNKERKRQNGDKTLNQVFAVWHKLFHNKVFYMRINKITYSLHSSNKGLSGLLTLPWRSPFTN